MLHRFEVLLSIFIFCVALSAQEQPVFSGGGGKSMNATVLATGDFNKDGLPDIAAASFNNDVDSVGISFNQGNFQFADPVYNPVTGHTASIMVADVNGDSWPDILAASYQQGTVSVLLNNGNGTFRAGVVNATTYPINRAVTADFNRDGKADIATNECSSTSCYIGIYLGTGTGTFAPRSLIDKGGLGSGIQAGDFNRDGNIDVASMRADFKLLVWFGGGNGSFGSPFIASLTDHSSSTSASNVRDLVVGDFTGDGVPDIATNAPNACGSACGENWITIFKSDGAGGFTKINEFSMGPPASGNIRVGDLNNDLKQDIITEGPDHFGGGADVVLGRGDGTFADSPFLPTPDELNDLQIRDMDNDGKEDLIYSQWYSPSFGVARNAGTTVNCATPSSSALRASICSPSGTSSASPMIVKAAGNAPTSVKRMEVWVDGAKKSESYDDQIATTVALNAGSHTLTVVTIDIMDQFSKTTKTVTVGSTSGACPYNGGLNVCSPSEGSTTTSPVRVSASAQSDPRITGMRVYVDNVSAFNTTASQFVTDISMSTGGHTLVIKSWDATGRTMSTTRHVTVSSSTGGSCSTPSVTPSVNICTPTEGSTVSSNVHITAKARWDGKILSGARVYVDNVSVWSSGGPASSVDTTVTLGAGTHTMVVKFWESGGTSISATRRFTVQ